MMTETCNLFHDSYKQTGHDPNTVPFYPFDMILKQPAPRFTTTDRWLGQLSFPNVLSASSPTNMPCFVDTEPVTK